ncbi:hypothetical protein [Actinoalloteichus spitiensis]|uniref:hypothetical protein n=1 Tax=Actinoalloteichus spitiensis TaxID=252394 RepID=UPI00037DB6C9|nr:hypothetical protein [Actinoalloteichus spitiensis]
MLPGDEGHRRKPPLEPGDLLVWHVAEDGANKASYDFGQLAVGPRLQRELAEAFAVQCGPTGTWKTLPSSRETWLILLYFSRFLAEQEHVPQSLGELTADIWAAWRLSRTPNSTGSRQVRKVARLLKQHPLVPEETRKLMSKRMPKEKAPKETAYSDAEFDRIKLLATQRFRPALHRIRANRQHLLGWRAGQFERGTDGWLIGEALDQLIRTGETPFFIRPDGRHRPDPRYTEALGGNRAEDTWMRLFLTTDEGCALMILIIAAYGWNATPVVEMKVPDASPDAGNEGQIIYRVELEKRRRRPADRYETRNLADWGANSPGRLITHAIESTAPAREMLKNVGAPTDRLIVWRLAQRRAAYGEGTAGLFDGHFHANVWRNWRQELGGEVSLNLRRLRKTVVIAHQRQPTQHSQDTHDGAYVLPDPRTHAAAQPVITDGVEEAIEAARSSFKAQISRTDTDVDQDTTTTSCSDYTHSPFAEQGVPCRASFLLCTACPNAVITPRHLPRLAYLLYVLEELRAVLSPEVWDQDWREPFTRLRDLRKAPDFTNTEWNDALEKASAHERRVIDQLLKKGLDA